jgi:integral membrane protein (TIGR01906 family)
MIGQPMPMVTLTRSLVRLFQTLMIVALPLILVLGAVQLLVTDGYLAFEYGKADFPPDVFGLSQPRRLDYAAANFRYVREAQPLSALAEQVLDGQPAYNTRELGHMRDVQRVYQASAWAWQSALILVTMLAFTLGWRAENRPALASALKWGGLASAGLMGAMGLLALVAWQVWFLAFHQVFFAAGTWTFAYSDILIRLFPNRFWFDAALTITGLTTGAGLLVSGIGAWLVRPARFSAPAAVASPQP